MNIHAYTEDPLSSSLPRLARHPQPALSRRERRERSVKTN
jgi:hypothetical protein